MPQPIIATHSAARQVSVRGLEHFSELDGLDYVDGTEGVWIFRVSDLISRQVLSIVRRRIGWRSEYCE